MTFKRKDHHKKARVGNAWRRPRGLQNKLRLQKKGHDVRVKDGYGKSEKNKFKGLDIVFVERFEDLKNLDPKKHALQIKKLSIKNKIKIIEEAIKKQFTFANLRAEAYLKNAKERLAQNKNEKAKKEEKKKVDEKAQPEKTEDKKEEKSVEEQKKEEKKEKDKVLTKSK